MSNVFIGRYKVIEELGRGGMGIVYRGEDPALDRPVAIKVLPPKKLAQQKAIKRFLREARLCARLDHPNIIKIHDIGEEEGIYHIVMELVEGRSLRDLIEARESVRAIDLHNMLEIFHEVCEALSYAHDKKIVHRDLKPDNIMLTTEGRVKVMDFGLAVIEDRHSLTEMGQVMGTVAYFSPEQAKGEPADHRSDIYSLGAVLFEMLTNHLVFSATNPGEMIAKHLTSPPPNPKTFNPAIPPVICNMILMTLKKNPNDRIQSVDAMLEILDGYFNIGKNGSKGAQAVPQQMPPHVEPEPEPIPPPPPPRREQREPDIPSQRGSFDSGYVPRSLAGDEHALEFDDDPAPYQEMHTLEDQRYGGQPAQPPQPPPASPPQRQYDDTPSGGSFALPNQNAAPPARKVAPEPPHETPPQRKGDEQGKLGMVNPESRQRQNMPQYFDRTEDMILKIPVNPEPKKPPPAPPESKTPPPAVTAGDSPVASSQWLAEASHDKQKYSKFRHVADKVKKDEIAREAAGPGQVSLMCPRCGAENDEGRRYCRQCGNLISQEHFIAQKEAQSHIQRGKDLLKEGRLEEAASEFRQATMKDATMSEAFMLLGKVLGDTGKYQEARAAYRSASALLKEDPKPHILIGDLYRLENRRDDAIYEYREAAKLAPNDISIRSQLALLYSQKGDINKAIDSYQRILVIEPTHLEAHRQLGYLYMAQEKVNDAIREFEYVIKIDPNDEQVFQVLGTLYIKVGRLGNAEQVMRSVLEAKPNDPEAMATLGEIYEKQNRVDLALDHLTNAVRNDAANVDARKKLATIYTKHSRPDLAQKELEEAVKYDPADPEIHKNLGDVYLKSNQIDRALLHFEQTVNLSPESADMHHKLAKLYSKKDYAELSINEFKKATELQPYIPEYREDLSMAYYQQNRYDDAITEMKKAATLDSTNLEYQKALGVMYEETNHLDKAREHLLNVIEKNPRDAMAQGMLGRVYSKQNLMKMAVLQYEKALQLNPESHLFHIYLGKTYAQQGRLKDAAELFKRAIELAPGGSAARGTRILGKAYADLGRVYIEQGELQKALDVLQSAEANNPNDARTLHYMGVLYHEMKKNDKAHEYLSRSLKLSPNSADTMRDFALVCNEMGNFTMALSLIRKSINLAPSEVQGYENLAKVLLSMGRYPEAQQALSDAISMCPDDADFLFWIKGNMAGERKDWERAAEYFQESVIINDTEWYYFRDLADALEHLEDYGRALQEYNNALACEPGDEEAEKIRSKVTRLRRKVKER